MRMKSQWQVIGASSARAASFKRSSGKSVNVRTSTGRRFDLRRQIPNREIYLQINKLRHRDEVRHRRMGDSSTSE
jgi:hypothetical protein